MLPGRRSQQRPNPWRGGGGGADQNVGAHQSGCGTPLVPGWAAEVGSRAGRARHSRPQCALQMCSIQRPMGPGLGGQRGDRARVGTAHGGDSAEGGTEGGVPQKRGCPAAPAGHLQPRWPLFLSLFGASPSPAARAQPPDHPPRAALLQPSTEQCRVPAPAPAAEPPGCVLLGLCPACTHTHTHRSPRRDTRMDTHIQVCTSTGTHTFTCTCAHTQMWARSLTCAHIHACSTSTYTSVHAHTCTFAFSHAQTCMPRCLHVPPPRPHEHTDVNTHTHTRYFFH